MVVEVNLCDEVSTNAIDSEKSAGGRVIVKISPCGELPVENRFGSSKMVRLSVF